MAIRVGINGFGRIGRNILRASLHDKDIEFVAVNDITDAATLAHLLKYDSILGNLAEDVKAEGDTIHVAGRAIKVLAIKNPGDLPWTIFRKGPASSDAPPTKTPSTSARAMRPAMLSGFTLPP